MKEMYELIEKISGDNDMIYNMLTNELEQDLFAVIKKHANMYHRNGFINESETENLINSCIESFDDYIYEN